MQKHEKELVDEIGRKIKELRKKAGYSSQETFAYDADLPRALYGRHEKGANLTILSLLKILRKHKIKFEDFFKNI
jgi:DNA-binding XRE family transcriptional regulator